MKMKKMSYYFIIITITMIILLLFLFYCCLIKERIGIYCGGFVVGAWKITFPGGDGDIGVVLFFLLFCNMVGTKKKEQEKICKRGGTMYKVKEWVYGVLMGTRHVRCQYDIYTDSNGGEKICMMRSGG